MGLKVAKPKVDWEAMLDYKQGVIDGNTKGIEFLFKKNKVDWIKGWASIPEAWQGQSRRRHSRGGRTSSSQQAPNLLPYRVSKLTRKPL
jgi:pyruvate/2-oxoglutarate dehydrogenase complex dihydrolipoamide dehydrogenase (E3) component